MYKYLALAAVMAAISSPALANHDNKTVDEKALKKAEHFLDEADTNKDNILSKEESTAYSDRMFKEADTDSNGSVSKTELVAKKKAEIEKWHDSKKTAE